MQLLHTRLVELTALRQIFLILQRRTGCRQGEAVDVERLANTVQHVRHHRGRQTVANTQCRQTISLGKSARNQQIGVSREEIQTVRQIAAFGVLDVSLVQHHQYMLRNILQELVQRFCAEPGAGRIVRIGDEHDTGIGIDGREHRRQVMPPILGRHHFGLCADGLSGDRVHRERVLTEHGIQARRQIGTRDQLKNVIGTVAQSDLAQFDTALLGQQGFQRKTVAIRVTGQLGQLFADGCQSFRTGA
ncbi:hypothetical protein D3C73_200770 [compost metagenome]